MSCYCCALLPIFAQLRGASGIWYNKMEAMYTRECFSFRRSKNGPYERECEEWAQGGQGEAVMSFRKLLEDIEMEMQQEWEIRERGESKREGRVWRDVRTI